jgi:transcriptional regulator with XRE-family HTH domain
MTEPAQLRAARALIGWSQKDLAEAFGVSTMTIKRAEGSGKPPAPHETLAALRAILEAEGVVFIDRNGGGLGVRLKA